MIKFYTVRTIDPGKIFATCLYRVTSVREIPNTFVQWTSARGAGEELLINYGPPDKLWFQDVTAPAHVSSSDDGSDGGLSRLQL